MPMTRDQRVRALVLWFLIFLVVTALPRVSSQAMEEQHGVHNYHNEEGEDESDESLDEDEDESSEEEHPYFYVYEPESPIVEFTLPPDEDVWAHHDFLLKPDHERHRIVEFYAHWCPHCRFMRNHYIRFAKKIKEVGQHYNIPIEVYGVSCVPHRPVCQHFGVHAYPGIFLIPKGQTEPVSIEFVELHPLQVLGMIGLELDGDFEEEPEHLIVPSIGTAPGEDFFLPRRKKDIYNDAYLSFQFAMKNGIFKGPGPLSNSTKDLLLGFLELVQSTSPPSLGLHKLSSDLLSNSDAALASEEALVATVDKYPPKRKTWSFSCTRGDPAMGYTCGLWELFHILTVGFVEFNNMVTAEDDYSFYRPADTSMILKNFVENFFGCEVCRTHFVQAYDGCEYNGCNRLVTHVGTLEEWMELPMWLYEFHNGVNIRLMKERAEREGRVPTAQDEIAVQWPSRKDCPMCWNDDGQFDPSNVYIFLRLTYWPDDLLSEQLRMDLMGSDLNLQRQRKELQHRLVTGLKVILVLIGVGGALWYEHRRRMKILTTRKKNP